MKAFFTTRRLCRAGIIAALYVALTYAFMPIAYQGILQIRPAEALCILPLFYAEAVPALFVACALSNLASPFLLYDVPIGSVTTLIAAALTWLIGFLWRNRTGGLVHTAKIALGGLFPVLLNAFIIPITIVILCGDVSASADGIVSVAYWINFGSMCLTEGLWIWALGTPLYFFILRMQKRGVAAFTDARRQDKRQTN